MCLNEVKMGKEYTLDQVKEHNKPTDLWIVIDNNVYDVTKYVKEVWMMIRKCKT